MSDPDLTLQQQVSALVERFFRQNGLPELSDNEVRDVAERFIAVLSRKSMPHRLRADEMGEPGEMSAEDVSPLVESVVLGAARAADLVPVVRQLIKTCYHPEFKKCRESYREREHDGTCRRQSLDRARARISGSHCVDCPYWTALTPQQHEACLAGGWSGDVTEFQRHRAIFLPEDFRAFRQRVRSLAPDALSDDRRSATNA